MAVVRVRLVAAAAAGALAGLGGGLYAHLLTYVEPGNFNIMLGVHSLAYGLIGGLGTALGPVLGVLIDIGLLESSRLFAGYRMIVFGGLVAVLLIVRPRGLLDERAVHRLVRLLQGASRCCCELEGLTVRFGGVEALGPVDLSLAAGCEPRPHGAERLRQDHALQCHQRRRAPGLAAGCCSASATSRHCRCTRSPGSASPAPFRPCVCFR